MELRSSGGGSSRQMEQTWDSPAAEFSSAAGFLRPASVGGTSGFGATAEEEEEEEEEGGRGAAAARDLRGGMTGDGARERRRGWGSFLLNEGRTGCESTLGTGVVFGTVSARGFERKNE